MVSSRNMGREGSQNEVQEHNQIRAFTDDASVLLLEVKAAYINHQ